MLFVILTLFTALVLVASLKPTPRRGRLPPGPKGLPLFGNAFQLPQYQFFRFTEWKAQFGPLFSLNLFGQPAIVINSLEVAGDLLERRSGIYSDRPRLIVGGLLTGQLFLPFMRYGDTWRKHRKSAQEGLRSQVVPAYQQGQGFEAIILAENLLQNSEAWENEVNRSTSSSMKVALYGTASITSKTDPLVESVNEIGHRITTATEPGRYLVEFFPQMIYLPTWLAPWKRKLRKHFEQDTQELENLLGSVKEEIGNFDDHKPSVVANVLRAGGRHRLNATEEAWLLGTLFIAGSDTSSAAFGFFLLAMCLYPNVMRKAQSQLDCVVGRDRVPNFSDREQLPYLRALIKEVTRWAPVAPLGGVRQTREDDYYDGYFIPKGTLVFPNAWGMNNDPEVYPNPDEFRPERFLDASETVDIEIPGTRDGHITFGFGRRICVGRNLADQFQFINIATLLWAANIEAGVDKNGEVVRPSNSPEYWVDQGAVIRPAPFPCRIVPRFDGVEKILQHAREERSSGL